MKRKLNRISIANKFGLAYFILHVALHSYAATSPALEVSLNKLFVGGPHVLANHFDSNPIHIIVSTIFETSGVWLLVFLGVTIYTSFAD